MFLAFLLDKSAQSRYIVSRYGKCRDEEEYAFSDSEESRRLVQGGVSGCRKITLEQSARTVSKAGRPRPLPRKSGHRFGGGNKSGTAEISSLSLLEIKAFFIFFKNTLLGGYNNELQRNPQYA